MRPIRITGVTGSTQWVPLDTYSPAQATVYCNTAAGAVQYTLDNVFDEDITPTPIAVTLGAEDTITLPAGARAVRATGLLPAELLIVSQQGIA
jgi:hypothetical protein